MIAFIQATREAVKNNNWYAALSLALTLPDIACSLENADGRTNGQRFAVWFDKWMPEYSSSRTQRFSTRIIENPPFMVGRDCYALRCAVLHNGVDDIEEQRARESLKQFVFMFGGNVHRNLLANGAMLQLDVGRFASEMSNACEKWRDQFLKNEPEAADREARLIAISDARLGFTIGGPSLKRP